MKSFLKIGARIIGGVSFVAVVIALVGYLTGFLYVGVKQPAQAVANRSVVCDSATVGRYNQIMSVPTKDNAGRTEKAKNLQQYVNQIKSKAGFSDDPTCVYIAFSSAILSADQNDAKTQLASIKSFADKGVYPSLSLIDIMGTDSMQSRIDALTPVGDNANQNGRG